MLSNLLPEGRRLETLRQRVTTSLDHEVALLLAIGNDLVGDLQFVPAGTRPAGSSATPVDLDRLDTVEFAELRGLPVRMEDVPAQLSAARPRASSTYRRVLEQRRHRLSRWRTRRANATR